jgi:hypothetical protein
MNKEILEALIRRLEVWGLFFGVIVVIGVAGESVIGVRIWWNNRKLRKLQEAENLALQLKISDFQRKAEDAKRGAAAAESHLAEARQKAAEADAKAEGFRLDIARANERAAKAEKETTGAKLELERLRSPRSLTGVPKLISELSELKGTEYTFSSVFPDEESITLLRSIDGALQESGWKRGKPVPGFPGVNVFGSGNPYGVPSALTNGIRISVDWPEGFSPLESLPIDKLPMPVRAAAALFRSLSSHISPAEEHPNLVDVQKGESNTIRISVGKKP